jgi:tRNA A22 N-methylase
MGGKEIGEILEVHHSQLDWSSRIIISPHKNILELRKKLAQLNYGVETEEIIKDQGRFYQVLVLSQNSELPLISPYGNRLWDHPLGREYRERELAHFSSHRDASSKEYCRFLEQLSL